MRLVVFFLMPRINEVSPVIEELKSLTHGDGALGSLCIERVDALGRILRRRGMNDRGPFSGRERIYRLWGIDASKPNGSFRHH
jgi:hypothetical protein